jgi:regulatory protein
MKPVRAARPVTPERLEAAAFRYLERFATSSANLRRVLARRVRRSAALHGTDAAEGAAWIEALIQRFLDSGLLDDQAYAEARTASLHRRGRSARAIGAKLAEKGVSRALIAENLAHDGESRPGGDLAAAAVLARAGFARNVAERVLDCPDAMSLAALLTET